MMQPRIPLFYRTRVWRRRWATYPRVISVLILALLFLITQNRNLYTGYMRSLGRDKLHADILNGTLGVCKPIVFFDSGKIVQLWAGCKVTIRI
jgi:hypothetical protein